MRSSPSSSPAWELFGASGHSVGTPLRAPESLAQLLFTPLLAAWSIWVGIVDLGQIEAMYALPGSSASLASLPSVAVTTLIALDVIPPTLGLALGGAAVRLVFVLPGWRITSAALDRERLITGTR